MKHLISVCICALLMGVALLSCTPHALKVSVANTLPIERDHETVSVDWSTITAALPEATRQNVIVLDASGAQLPSQVTPMQEPEALLFQVTVGPNAEAHFTITTGEREDYPALATGRYVPERADDYAWENTLVAFRIYGPALDPQLKSLGMDIWDKNVTRFVTKEGDWFTRSYHNDIGEGMDCYKVGATLGCGASAPFVDGKIWLETNYSRQETLDDGPIRARFRLEYDAIPVQDGSVQLTKIISLDAYSHLCTIESTFSGSFETLPVVTGIIRHDVISEKKSDSAIVLSEIPSDSKKEDPHEDGIQFLAAVMAPGQGAAYGDVENHSVFHNTVKNGQTLVSYAGGAWSKGGQFSTVAQWESYMDTAVQKINNPLVVTCRP